MLPRDLGNGSRTAESTTLSLSEWTGVRRDPGGALGGGGRGQASPAPCMLCMPGRRSGMTLSMPSPTFGQQRWKRSANLPQRYFNPPDTPPNLILVISASPPQRWIVPLIEALTDLSRTARLIVLGSDEVSLGTAILVGSTTTAVATHSICPVVAWRGDASTPTRLPIDLGIDHDHDSRVAVTAAFEFADRFDVGIIAVHAWSTRGPAGDVTLPSMIDWNKVENDARRHLSDVLSPWGELYPDVEVAQIVDPDKPRRALLRHSQDAPDDCGRQPGPRVLGRAPCWVPQDSTCYTTPRSR